MSEHASQGTSVVIINDSAVARTVTAAVVRADGGFRLLGEATGGIDGVKLVCAQRPRLVLLDMHMPDINGVEVTRRIMSECATRILITSATIRRNTTFLFDALGGGALDYCHTPALRARPGESVTRLQLLEAGAELLRKMRTVARLPLRSPQPGSDAVGRRQAWMPPTPTHQPPPRAAPIVGIGCSTGGPTALCRLLGGIRPGAGAAILVSQHIEREFTPGLAGWLATQTGHPVKVARDGERPEPGRVYLAEGGRSNLLLTRGGSLRYEPAPDALYYPNISRMFQAIADGAGRRACGVILTGLGDDGTTGLAALKAAGGRVLVQDPASAAVDGMPGAVLRAGVCTQGQDLDDLGRLISHWIETHR